MLHVVERDQHKDRAIRIRRAHPDVAALSGKSAWTAVLGLAIFAAHFTVAVLLRDASPWLALAVAWLFGAFCVHATFIVIHEGCHRLIFTPMWANRLLTLVINVPLLAPFGVPLMHYHIVHHYALGQAGRDPDLPMDWEIRLFDRSRLHRFVWQILFGLLSAIRPGEKRDRLPPWDPWLIANTVLQVAATIAILLALGPMALLYLAASCAFMFTLHPLFGRFVQEHFIVRAPQETNSYYGALNKVSLNFGYHTEHHDFSSIPWFNLPKLTALAPEFYRDRAQHRSWTRLWLHFMFTKEPQLSRRIVRDSQKAPLTASPPGNTPKRNDAALNEEALDDAEPAP